MILLPVNGWPVMMPMASWMVSRLLPVPPGADRMAMVPASRRFLMIHSRGGLFRMVVTSAAE